MEAALYSAGLQFITETGGYDNMAMAMAARSLWLRHKALFGDTFPHWTDEEWRSDAWNAILNRAIGEMSIYDMRAGRNLIEISPEMTAELSTDQRSAL